MCEVGVAISHPHQAPPGPPPAAVPESGVQVTEESAVGEAASQEHTEAGELALSCNPSYLGG